MHDFMTHSLDIYIDSDPPQNSIARERFQWNRSDVLRNAHKDLDAIPPPEWFYTYIYFIITSSLSPLRTDTRRGVEEASGLIIEGVLKQYCMF